MAPLAAKLVDFADTIPPPSAFPVPGTLLGSFINIRSPVPEPAKLKLGNLVPAPFGFPKNVRPFSNFFRRAVSVAAHEDPSDPAKKAQEVVAIVVGSLMLLVLVLCLVFVFYHLFKRLPRLSTYIAVFRGRMHKLDGDEEAPREETPRVATTHPEGLRYTHGDGDESRRHAQDAAVSRAGPSSASTPRPLPPVYGAWVADMPIRTHAWDLSKDPNAKGMPKSWIVGPSYAPM